MDKDYSPDKKSYWYDGYFYVVGRTICGICCSDLGDAEEGEEASLSYCGCEEANNG